MCPADDWLDPSTLDPASKRALWLGIKTLNPGFAKLLSQQSGKKNVNKALRLNRDKAERYLAEGRRQLNQKD